MKWIIYLLCFVSYTQVLAQDKYLFNVDSIEIVFEIAKTDSLIKENIIITNHSDHSIFIPKLPILKERYFFNLEDAIYSFSGVRNSMTGEMGLGGTIRLIEIKKGDTFKYEMNVSLQNDDPLLVLHFSFDFLKDLKMKIVKNDNDGYFIKEVDYFDSSQMIYSKHIN